MGNMDTLKKGFESVHWWQECAGCGQMFDRAKGYGKHTACYNELVRRPKTELERRRAKWDRKRPRLAPVVFANDNYRCVECRSPNELTVDHIVPISEGGSDDLSNLQTMCRPCNSSKGTMEGGLKQ